ncbi:MAG: serine hydrolase domain-containing protein, partial [Clostridia bacterium]
PCILRLLGDGWMQLESTLGELLPEPVDPGIAKITLYDLLTHTAGLIPDHDLRGKGTHAETMAWLRMQPPARPTGGDVVYSDVGFLLLGDVIEQFMGMRLDEAVQRLVWKPLGMQQTCFCPASESGPFAATEEVNGIVKCGVVHDENAEALGGIAGHAGAFSTASDLARYLRAWLTPELLDPVWVLRSFLNYTPGLSENRGLGWVVYREADTGNLVGHAGFTGTSLWMDEVTRRYAILLANRVHPSRQNAAMPAIRRKAIDWIFDEDATR